MSDSLENNTQLNEVIVPGMFCSLLLEREFPVKPLKNTADNIEVIQVQPDKLVDVITLLKNHNELQFNLLFSVHGIDYPEYFEVVYHIHSSRFNRKVILKTQIDKNNPEIDSVSHIFSTANWHERETYDLFGIKFNNHPDLRRILLPDDWKGHPLRKDYVMDDERLVWNER